MSPLALVWWTALALALGVGGAPPRSAASNGTGGYVVLITSPGAGDGTTSVALGLARAFGEMGRRTLAIEGNLRSPSFARELNVVPTPGLAGILADGRTLDNELLELPLGIGAGVPAGNLAAGPRRPLPQPLLAGTNTTIGVVATDAVITKVQAHRLAVAAHDGLARSINPVHTMSDGDTLFTLGTGLSGQHPGMLVLATMAAEATAIATARAVRAAQALTTSDGLHLPCCADLA